jgi:hypothetical protein
MGTEATRIAAALAFALALVAAATGAAGPQAPLDVVLVLDVSGSMTRNDPRRLVPKAASDFLRAQSEDAAVGLVVFGADARAVCPLAPLSESRHRSAFLRAVEGLEYSARLTDMAAGIERGLYELRERGRPGASQALVFVSDGIVETGSAARDEQRTEWLRSDLLAEARERGVRVFAIALSEQADFMLIREIGTRTGGEYYRASTDEEAARAFSAIGTRLKGGTSGDAESPRVSVPQEQPTTEQPSAPVGATALWVGAVVALALAAALAALAWRSRRRDAAGGRHAATRREVEVLTGASLFDVASGRRTQLDRSTISVGRDAANDVVILAGTISSRHACIDFRDGRYFLRDLRSANGTFLNGTRLTGEAALDDGDTIHFDEFRYRFESGARAGSGTIVRDPGRGDPAADAKVVRMPGTKRRRTFSYEDEGEDGDTPARGGT